MITGKAPTELIELLRPWFIEGWVPIAQSTLTGTAASVTFSSIPGDYRTLSVLIQGRTDLAAEFDWVLYRLNGDSGNNYDRVYGNFVGNNTRISGGSRATSAAYLSVVEAANARANNLSTSITFFIGYSETNREKWSVSLNARGFGDVSADADLAVQIVSGRWRSQNAITSITFLPDAGTNFVAGCIFQLYGIR